MIDPPTGEAQTRLNVLGFQVRKLQQHLFGGQPAGEEVAFFDTTHSRAWIMVRRIAHTAHHRAEQTTLLRLLGRRVWSVYGPSVDTGGLPANGARTIYAYADVEALIAGESRGGAKTALPGPGAHPSTERSGQR